MDASRSQVDVSKGQADEPRGQVDLLSMLNGTETANMSHGDSAGTYLGAGGMKCLVLEPNGFGDVTETLSARTDIHSTGNKMETSEIKTKIVSNHRNSSKTRNSPYTHEIVTSNPTYQWRSVSIDNVDVYIPWNAPVEAPSRTFAFGEAESGDEAIVPDIEGEMAEGNGDGDGDQYGDDGDSNGIMSGGSVDSV